LTRLYAAPLMGLLLLRMLGDTHVQEHWAAYGEQLSKGMLALLDAQSTADAPPAQSTKSQTVKEQVKKKKKKKKGKKS